VQPTLSGEAARQRQDEIDLRVRDAHHTAAARTFAPRRRALLVVVAIAAMLALAAAAGSGGNLLGIVGSQVRV
jgi:hypothetical protein